MSLFGRALEDLSRRLRTRANQARALGDQVMAEDIDQLLGAYATLHGVHRWEGKGGQDARVLPPGLTPGYYEHLDHEPNWSWVVEQGPTRTRHDTGIVFVVGQNRLPFPYPWPGASYPAPTAISPPPPFTQDQVDGLRRHLNNGLGDYDAERALAYCHHLFGGKDA